MSNLKFLFFLLLIPVVILAFGEFSVLDRPVIKQRAYYCWDGTPLLALHYLHSTDSSQVYWIESHYSDGNEEFFPNGRLTRMSDNSINLELNSSNSSESIALANFNLDMEVDSVSLYWNRTSGLRVDLLSQFIENGERIQELIFFHPDYGSYIYEFGIKSGFSAVANQRGNNNEFSYYTRLGESMGLAISKDYRRYLENK
jgi:hypothetical protein